MNQSVKCQKCGQTELIWAKSKAGKFYLADPGHVQFGERQHKLVAFAHKCAVRPNAFAAEVAKAELKVRAYSAQLSQETKNSESYTAYAGFLAQAEEELQALKGDR